MIIDECQEKMNCLYSLVNVSSVITNLFIFIAGGGGSFGGNTWFSGGTEGVSGILIQPPTPPAPAPAPAPPLRARAIKQWSFLYDN